MKTKKNYSTNKNKKLTKRIVNKSKKKSKKATKCDYYMSPQYLNDIQERRFKEWIKSNYMK